VSTISLLGCSTSVALTTDPIDEEEGNSYDTTKRGALVHLYDIPASLNSRT